MELRAPTKRTSAPEQWLVVVVETAQAIKNQLVSDAFSLTSSLAAIDNFLRVVSGPIRCAQK